MVDYFGVGYGMDIKEAIARLAASDDHRVIERLQIPTPIEAPLPAGTVKRGVYLDIETTGLYVEEDEIIELALVPFAFDESANIIGSYEPLNMLQEPAAGAISEEITTLTGISFEEVRGQAIDWQKVRDVIVDAAIIIAHNSAFDRPFLEKVESMFELKAWGCSLSDIDWRGHGFESGKLEYLALKSGFFFEGHRATIDCYAGLRLLSGELGETGSTALSYLLESARQRTCRIWAENAPFDFKDHLKKRGYRWNDGSDSRPRAWYVEIQEPDVEAELEWLRSDIYQDPEAAPVVTHFNAFSRYSNRV